MLLVTIIYVNKNIAKTKPRLQGPVEARQFSFNEYKKKGSKIGFMKLYTQWNM